MNAYQIPTPVETGYPPPPWYTNTRIPTIMLTTPRAKAMADMIFMNDMSRSLSEKEKCYNTIITVNKIQYNGHWAVMLNNAQM